jgi:hypothetical protein
MGQMRTNINKELKQGLVYRNVLVHVMGIPTNYNNKDYKGIIPSIPPVNSMLPVHKVQKASQECVWDNQKKTIQINHEKDVPYSLPRGSILVRKSYLRTLADPTRIPPEPALCQVKEWQLKTGCPLSIKS